VHNPGHIPEQVQLQIFQRSFSTKGPGRGLGTYCMRLIGERYLKGQITFISIEKDGITFKASIPLKLE
jgi:sensor histidine kinase regulating citrate/malate metabolism